MSSSGGRDLGLAAVLQVIAQAGDIGCLVKAPLGGMNRIFLGLMPRKTELLLALLHAVGEIESASSTGQEEVGGICASTTWVVPRRKRGAAADQATARFNRLLVPSGMEARALRVAIGGGSGS